MLASAATTQSLMPKHLEVIHLYHISPKFYLIGDTSAMHNVFNSSVL